MKDVSQTLEHEAWDDAMEIRVLVAEAIEVSAQGTEVFNSLWTLAAKELNDNAAHILLFDGDVEKDSWMVWPACGRDGTLQTTRQNQKG